MEPTIIDRIEAKRNNLSTIINKPQPNYISQTMINLL